MAGIIKVNQYQDFNGNTLFTSDGNGNLTTQKILYPAFEANLSANQSIADNTTVKVEFDREVFDTDNCYDNSTNYRFTPTKAGKYFVYSRLQLDAKRDAELFGYDLAVGGESGALAEVVLAPAAHGACLEQHAGMSAPDLDPLDDAADVDRIDGGRDLVVADRLRSSEAEGPNASRAPAAQLAVGQAQAAAAVTQVQVLADAVA